MNCNWKNTQLANELDLQYGKGLKVTERNVGDIPVYGSNGVVGYHDEYLVRAPGIIIGRKGSVGEIKYSDKDFFPIDTTYYVTLKNNNCMRFFYYFLQTLQLNKMNSHSAVPGLNRNDVYSIEILLPPLPEQKALAAVLSSLDDKIDLLHRQNKNLEAMAETLFRQWFIEEADESWEEGKLGDLLDLAYGKGLKKEDRTGKGYPVVGSSGIVDYHSEFLVKGPGIVIGRKGTLGQTIFMSNNFYPIDTTFYVVPQNERTNFIYEYFLLRSINFLEMNSDSAVPGLNKNIALSTELLIPAENTINEFNKYVEPFWQKKIENQNQIQTLEKLRDTLLPKLMSGEVRVLH
ncbi:MAG: restriction endonuclease subunit S [Melioribacteraceae bacterium]|nr:restriction endonuclease subunit S [Melioribacteraceae bacterium]